MRMPGRPPADKVWIDHFILTILFTYINSSQSLFLTIVFTGREAVRKLKTRTGKSRGKQKYFIPCIETNVRRCSGALQPTSNVSLRLIDILPRGLICNNIYVLFSQFISART